MIAKLASEGDIPVNGRNEDFKQLCKDILGHPLSRCLDSEVPLKEAEEMILTACENMKVTE